MDLFETAEGSPVQEPLAYRMRPRTLDEFIGQEHIVGPGRLLRRVIQTDQPTSIIFYGPPGTGKTTLARIIANATKSHFITINAVLSGVKDLRAAIDEAKQQRDLYSKRTLLFIDEVHRWNKAQQDALLPWVENGTVILIGATTQNPFFEVNPALVSRSRVFQLTSLTVEDLRHVAHAALSDPVRGYGAYRVRVDSDALDHLVTVANGDARSLLNALELAVETTPEEFPPPGDEEIRVTLQIAEESIQRKVVLYDKEGDYHFDTISAFIKSIRGSDPDATLYWMARMIYGGEDPRYIFRRMLISASEDIGLADPEALARVEAAASAFDRVGMPEGQFFLSQTALYLATAPKSNSTLGFFDAVQAVEKEQTDEIPSHLRDANRDAEALGHGSGYLYPHAYRDHWVVQHYLPPALQGTYFYDPGRMGYEGHIRTEVLRKREAQIAATDRGASDEVLTFSPPDRGRDRWFSRLVEQRGRTLEAVREELFAAAGVLRHHRVLDLRADHGLLVWEAVRSAPEGQVTGIVRDNRARIEHIASELPEIERPVLVTTDGTRRDALSTLESDCFEIAVGYNVLVVEQDPAQLLGELVRTTVPEGTLALAEMVPSEGQLLADLLTGEGAIDRERIDRFRLAERSVRQDPSVPAYRWSESAITELCSSAGYRVSSSRTIRYTEERVLTSKEIDTWLSADPGASVYCSALRRHLTDSDLAAAREALLGLVDAGPVSWRRAIAFVTARLPE